MRPCIMEVIYWLFLLFMCYESIKIFYKMPKTGLSYMVHCPYYLKEDSKHC